MADISVQFYATDEELINWVSSWASAYSITIVAMRNQPFSATEVPSSQIANAIRDSNVWRLIIYLSRVVFGARNQLDFEDSNEDGLVLDVGRLSRDGLAESWLACRTGDKAAFAKWQRIARDLKSRTKQGITLISRENGDSAFSKGHRYSEGAAELEASGISMIATQGVNGPMVRLGSV